MLHLPSRDKNKFSLQNTPLAPMALTAGFWSRCLHALGMIWQLAVDAVANSCFTSTTNAVPSATRHNTAFGSSFEATDTGRWGWRPPNNIVVSLQGNEHCIRGREARVCRKINLSVKISISSQNFACIHVCAGNPFRTLSSHRAHIPSSFEATLSCCGPMRFRPRSKRADNGCGVSKIFFWSCNNCVRLNAQNIRFLAV